MREFKLRTAIITVIIIIAVSSSILNAQYRVNINLGGGMHVPLGDLADESLLRAQAGAKHESWV